MVSKYPQSDYPTRLVTGHSSFTVEDSGMVYHQYPLFSLIFAGMYPKWAAVYALIGRQRWHVSREVVYTNNETGAKYGVTAHAWEIRGGVRIQKALFINEVYQYPGESTLLKHPSDNALFGMVASTENAVRNMLAHAEAQVKAMALNASAILAADKQYNEWLDSLQADTVATA